MQACSRSREEFTFRDDILLLEIINIYNVLLCYEGYITKISFTPLSIFDAFFENVWQYVRYCKNRLSATDL